MKTTQTLIILLLAANLAATVFFGIQNKPGTGGNPADQTARHALPSMITPEVRNNLFDQFITAFNSRDVDAM